jgi:drug/metabolite transporter (DMT)-like permease
MKGVHGDGARAASVGIVVDGVVRVSVVMAESGSEAGEARGVGPRTGGDLAAIVVLGLMVLITSSTAPAAKFAVRELPVELLLLVRFGVAGLCLLPIAWRGGALVRLFREDGGRLLLAAALCVPVNQMFFLHGARLVPTSHVALIYAACPLVVLALATALGQERPDRGRLFGVLASVLGVALIALDGARPGGTAGRAWLRGDLLTVGAVCSWGAYLTVSKPLVARHGALPALAGTFLVGGALAAPLALAMAPGWPALAGVSPPAWRGLAYLTLVINLFGLLCLNQAMRRFEASQVATVGNASPILTVIWGIWLFGESVTPALGLGGLMTLGGILWTGRPRGRHPAPPSPAGLGLIGSPKDIRTVADGGR